MAISTPKSVESDQIKTTGRSAQSCWRRRSVQFFRALSWRYLQLPDCSKLTWCERAEEARDWLHNTVRSSTRGSPTTTRFKTKSSGAFWRPDHQASGDTISPGICLCLPDSSKLCSKSEGTTGFLSYLSKSTAWLHDSYLSDRNGLQVLSCDRHFSFSFQALLGPSGFCSPQQPTHWFSSVWIRHQPRL